MKFSKEARIGVLVSASLLVLFFGFYFLKGLSLFSGDKEYYCVFNNVRGMQNQSNVEISGLSVGHIVDTKLIDKKGVRVKIAVHNDIVIPEGTTATLVSSDLLGGKAVVLNLGSGAGEIKPGSTIESKTEGNVMENLTDKLNPIFNDVKSSIIYLDTTIVRLNDLMNGNNRVNIGKMLAALSTTSENLAKVAEGLGKQSGDLAGILHSSNSIMANLAKSNDTVSMILSNFRNISSQLANSPIQKTMAALKSSLTELDSVMAKVNHGDGSAGMIVNDKELYKNLDKSLKSLHELLDDFKAHPKRYINVTVFGKKSKDN